MAERLHVELVEAASKALARLMERTGLKKVDLTNRSLQLYEFVDAEIRDGGKVVIRHEGTRPGEATRETEVKLFL
ncbi:hypothetical protein JOD54_005611 [Actinokineospora baliensis]|uniref:hypothetical protein n=1 Tax=Actinokineospora baliensis TaxID=547056 RepID=UPI0027DB24AC|nr:hypothetical protein [Actinokineospora baliensis]MBM7775407.1 hypothetical protein [Actinokineospora baliensis]